jgi:3-hydroxyacyl-CoA dehydrogenase/enoyl-CoA hydratase/3-hydroxybutyryl-CoA epimerase
MIGYDIDADGIATLTWDIPGRSMNVLNEATIEAFSTAFRKAVADDAVKGIIITSGKDAFLAGADLEMFLTMPTDDAAQLMAFASDLQGRFREIETCGKPVAAAINGTALGGGLEICLASHYRVAADRPKVQIGQPEVKIGLLPGAGGTQRIPRLIGARAALPLLLEGKSVNPTQAAQMGIIHKVVPADELLAEAKRWILEEGDPVQPWDKKGFKVPDGAVQSPKGYETFVAGNAMLHEKTWGNYEAPEAIISAVYEGLQVPIEGGLRIESRYLVSLLQGKQTRAMIRTLFFSMGDANKLKARPDAAPPADYAKIGVLGAGMMGAGIAHVSALSGLEVVLLDTSAELAEGGKAHSAGLLEKRVKRNRMSPEERDTMLGRIQPTDDFRALAGCELVIEAVFEDRGIKADVTQKTEAVLGPDVVFASNTSTLPITGLAEAWSKPDNFIGLHFFSPVDRMPLVEIIRGEATSDACLARAMDYVRRIRKTPIVVNDSRGFFTSRVFATYVNEGLAMLAEGVTPALIENGGRLAGMPVGPLAIADEVSLELIHRVREQTKLDLGDKYQPGPGEPVITTFVEELGRLGKKAGKGFYAYPDEGPKRLWPGLGEHYPPAADQPDVEAVKRRFLYIQAVESARCLEENVLTAAEDADVGSILGIGYPPFTGGVMSFVDGIGVAEFVAECDRLAQAHGPRFAPPKLLRDMAEKDESFYPRPKAAA